MTRIKALVLTALLFPCSLVVATYGQAQTTKADLLKIDKGFKTFTQETWNGNGRTCGTCHRPDESYNIFPSTIKTLSKSEQALVFATNVPGLENMDLVKSHAVFNVEADTPCSSTDPLCWRLYGKPGPTFRSTMNIQALDLTTPNPATFPLGTGADKFPGTSKLPAKCSRSLATGLLPQLGWSGDGSPGTPVTDNDCHVHHGFLDPGADGSIRAFCNGAVAQHSTKSLLRRPGTDFRLPTSDEMDSLEALQRWLGRRALTAEENWNQGTTNASEFLLTKLSFTDPRVAKGRDHFLGAGISNPNAPGNPPPQTTFNTTNGAGCQACHGDGGAISGIATINRNINLNTFVELDSEDIGNSLFGVALPLDDGGYTPFVPPPAAPRGAFNIQSIIEAAEKKAWFHNHKAVGDFEQAIAHYGSDDFVNNVAPPGLVAPLTLLQNGNGVSIGFPQGDGINHLGAFLRALNAFYNLRDCERLIDEAVTRVQLGISVDGPVRQSLFNLSRVIRVLYQSKLPGLYPDVQFGAAAISLGIEVAALTGNVALFQEIKVAVRKLRDSIAVQTSS